MGTRHARARHQAIRQHRRRRRPEPGGRRPGVPRAARPVGLREVDRAADDRRSRDADRRHDPHRRPRRQRRRAEGPRHRDGVPELRALPAHDGAPEHRVPAARRARSRRPSAPSSCAEAAETLGLDDLLDRKPAPALGRPTPAGRARRVRSCAGPRRSSWTSRSRTSTPSCACRPAPSSSSCSAACGRRSSTSPTTRSRR